MFNKLHFRSFRGLGALLLAAAITVGQSDKAEANAGASFSAQEILDLGIISSARPLAVLPVSSNRFSPPMACPMVISLVRRAPVP